MHHLCFEVKAIEDSVALLQRHAMRAVAPMVPAVAFGGRRIAWLTNSSGMLFELVEQGRGPLRLEDIVPS